MFRRGNPVTYHLPRNIEIKLYPQGEVAEFLFYDRKFERIELELVAAYLKPGMHVIDIGANIGLYSILSHKIVTPYGRVLAFKPSSESYRRLLNNIALNDCTCVMPIKMALSDKDGELLCLKSDPGY
jgi:predicted methyltransferase